MSYLIAFTDQRADRHDLVGGKGANLGRLVKAGFTVPAGFTVTTEAYADFLAGSGLDKKIPYLLDAINYDDAVRLELLAEEIRTLVTKTDMAAVLEAEICAAYHQLEGGINGGLHPHVAIRSSGTAEDLAEASFAGLHETFLDVQGDEEIVDAVKRCWASLWTARAIRYRHDRGFSHRESHLAVVIQKMVHADVAGVMFTANPVTGAVNEIVINANWGLGESVVSGIATPDEYVLNRDTLQIKRQTISDKQVQVVRNPATGVGTIREPLAPERRIAATLTTSQAAELGQLGRRVTEYYEGFPQDIEWALADGRFYLLQSRPVTGVEITWEEDIEGWQTAPEEDNTIWTNTWAEMYWTGGITPLFYSVRGEGCHNAYARLATVQGLDKCKNRRWVKYKRATVYLNANLEYDWQVDQWPAPLRETTHIPPAWQEKFAKEEVSPWQLIQLLLRVHALTPEFGVTRWWKTIYNYFDNRIDEANGMSPAELRLLTDEALIKEANARVAFADDEYFTVIWPGFFWLASGAFGALNLLLQKWYDGDPQIFQDLISGLPSTKLVEETEDLFDLATIIRRSVLLSQLFREHSGERFFQELTNHTEGHQFLEKYRQFLSHHGHRGHQDRDAYYDRRIEKPSLDYAALSQLLSTQHPVDPREHRKQMIAKREAATAAVVANLAHKPLGDLRVLVFRSVLEYCQRVLKFRDDSRHYLDRLTYAKKKAFSEIGRRMFERGMIAEEDDFWFLARHELYAHFEGRTPAKLSQAKMTARKRVFHRRNRREEDTPTWITNDGNAVDLSGKLREVEPGGLTGIKVSRGCTIGTSRIVPQLDQLGRIQEGDILVCNSTDPGWLSVFSKIRGVVLETGGILSHGACLSREYGIPAVQIRNAMQRIPGDTPIEVDGDHGTVRVMVEAEHGVCANGEVA
ncbi:MAG: PEP/pyruvate-binding domain-containing protein [Candidatus Binatia bacterium]